jgi:hypothetical protein
MSVKMNEERRCPDLLKTTQNNNGTKQQTRRQRWSRNKHEEDDGPGKLTRPSKMRPTEKGKKTPLPRRLQGHHHEKKKHNTPHL